MASKLTIRTVELLNKALVLDPQAIRQLFVYHVQCNDELAQHPTIQVVEAEDQEGRAPTVGLLGLLNGICGCAPDGRGLISAVYDSVTDELIRFELTEWNASHSKAKESIVT